MARGFCRKCGKEVGSLMKPAGYKCPRCNYVFCGPCSPKMGTLVKRPACPDCGVPLKQ